MRYIRNKETGKMEEWSDDYTPSKGFCRGQTIFGKKIREFSEEEWREIQNNAIEQKKLAQEKKERLEQEERRVEEYFNSLPSTLAQLTMVGREVEDDYGNYVLTLPKIAAKERWNIPQLEEYIINAIEEGCYE